MRVIISIGVRKKRPWLCTLLLCQWKLAPQHSRHFETRQENDKLTWTKRHGQEDTQGRLEYLLCTLLVWMARIVRRRDEKDGHLCVCTQSLIGFLRACGVRAGGVHMTCGMGLCAFESGVYCPRQASRQMCSRAGDGDAR